MYEHFKKLKCWESFRIHSKNFLQLAVDCNKRSSVEAK